MDGMIVADGHEQSGQQSLNGDSDHLSGFRGADKFLKAGLRFRHVELPHRVSPSALEKLFIQLLDEELFLYATPNFIANHKLRQFGAV